MRPRPLVITLMLLAANPNARASAHGAPPVSAEPPGLGHIEFPVTASEPARRHFLRGMLAMHSFWYEEARDEFQAATQAEPAFAMGYWGEALTYYRPVWTEENLVGSRAAMAKLPAAPKLSARGGAHPLWRG